MNDTFSVQSAWHGLRRVDAGPSPRPFRVRGPTTSVSEVLPLPQHGDVAAPPGARRGLAGPPYSQAGSRPSGGACSSTLAELNPTRMAVVWPGRVLRQSLQGCVDTELCLPVAATGETASSIPFSTPEPGWAEEVVYAKKAAPMTPARLAASDRSVRIGNTRLVSCRLPGEFGRGFDSWHLRRQPNASLVKGQGFARVHSPRWGVLAQLLSPEAAGLCAAAPGAPEARRWLARRHGNFECGAGRNGGRLTVR